jgi:hypothetical protein
MKIPLLVLRGSMGLLAATRLASAPVDELTPILRDFLQQPNYRWVTPSSRGMPEEAGSMVGEDVEGQHEKNGYSKIAFKSGPHFLDGWYPAKARLGITDQSTFWSSHWVYEMPDGWARLIDLKFPRPAVPSHAPTPRPGSVRIAGTSTGIGTSGTLYRVAAAWRPDLEVEIMVENLAGVEKIRNGTFEIELAPKGAGLLALVPAVPMPLWPFHAENARGSVTVQIREGALAAYELKVEADVVGMGNRNHRVVSRTRHLSDLGTTLIEIPAEVEKALGR